MDPLYLSTGQALRPESDEQDCIALSDHQREFYGIDVSPLRARYLES